MPKDKKPRRRRPAPAAAAAPAPVEPEVLPAPRASATVESQRQAQTAPFVARLASVLRTVAAALIDVADATAEALTKRLAGTP